MVTEAISTLAGLITTPPICYWGFPVSTGFPDSLRKPLRAIFGENGSDGLETIRWLAGLPAGGPSTPLQSRSVAGSGNALACLVSHPRAVLSVGNKRAGYRDALPNAAMAGYY